MCLRGPLSVSPFPVLMTYFLKAVLGSLSLDTCVNGTKLLPRLKSHSFPLWLLATQINPTLWPGLPLVSETGVCHPSASLLFGTQLQDQLQEP